ncbi:MAG TPA: hypothetical protein VJQ59_02650 [Candidatus Sulfotelmatobacter sp.]|nr:hypothetical protein [Candidatus Sulfotelmatobacter sp.]
MPNPAAALCRFPFGPKIATLQPPAAMLLSDTNIIVRIRKVTGRDINIEFNFWAVGSADKSGIAILQYGDEASVGRIHAHWHPPDLNDEAKRHDFGH